MSVRRRRVRVEGLEILAGEIIGLIRWYPHAGEWCHEMVTGPLHSVDEDGRIVLGVDSDALTVFDADLWAVCSTVPERIRETSS